MTRDEPERGLGRTAMEGRTRRARASGGPGARAGRAEVTEPETGPRTGPQGMHGRRNSGNPETPSRQGTERMPPRLPDLGIAASFTGRRTLAGEVELEGSRVVVFLDIELEVPIGSYIYAYISYMQYV